MTSDERHASALIAACAKEASAHILAYAREAGLDPPSFFPKIAAVLVLGFDSPAGGSTARRVPPHPKRLGLVDCLRGKEDERRLPLDGFVGWRLCNESVCTFGGKEPFRFR